MLGSIGQENLEAAAADEGFLSHLDRAVANLDTYMSGGTTWFRRKHGAYKSPLVAYFSAEFGVTECLQIFAGGLGVLAGDHTKSASDLGVPFIGVGLLYRQGYFRQYLNEAGRQQAAYDENDFLNLPLMLERYDDGSPIVVETPHPGRKVCAQVWKAQVGRVPLYLLDTNLPANLPEDRVITHQLYGGDAETRIRQEIILGIGGFRALNALNLNPDVYHMNEGHSAFLAIERIRQLMEKSGLNFQQALETTRAGVVFTTHTPVPAGHDYFSRDLVQRYFGEYLSQMGISVDDVMALGKQNPDDHKEPLSMTVLALRTSSYNNGVSKLHGEVSRKMWQSLWRAVPELEVPITSITNGIHIQSWVSRDMKELYDRYLGPRWRTEPADSKIWQRADQISGEELWRTHERRRERLVSFCRRRLQEQLGKRGASQKALEIAGEVLDPEALTIGFARRFATYKRATLLLRDPERLAQILNDPKRPVQIIMAGKAHPHDEPGKDLIQEIVELARKDEFRRRLVFIENYDMTVARYLVQGCDIWLNTPRRPREASGTSGMKAAANAVLNLSILDGWWDEAYTPHVGWAIGRREKYDDPEYQDQVEADAMYGLLESEIVPEFFDRGLDGLPRRWITRMKANIAALSHRFNTHRMVGEYTERFYLPAAERYSLISQDNLSPAKELAAWKARIKQNWPKIVIKDLISDLNDQIKVGSEFQVSANIYLGDLTPDDVKVELYLGQVSSEGEFLAAKALEMEEVTENGNQEYVYKTKEVVCCSSGLHGYTVRVLPYHPNLPTSFIPGLIHWA
jgi:starch phosphorylase